MTLDCQVLVCLCMFVILTRKNTVFYHCHYGSQKSSSSHHHLILSHHAGKICFESVQKIYNNLCNSFSDRYGRVLALFVEKRTAYATGYLSIDFQKTLRCVRSGSIVSPSLKQMLWNIAEFAFPGWKYLQCSVTLDWSQVCCSTRS